MFKEMKWDDAKPLLQKGIIYLEFITSWCGDCKLMEPIANGIATKYKNSKIEFIRINAEEAKLFREINTRWKVLKVPTHIILKDGVEMNRAYEYIPAVKLEAWLNALL